MFEEKLKSKTHNEHYLRKYISFIESVPTKREKYDVVHHICPKGKGCWPEFSNLKVHKWNASYLTHREHYIAHLLLWKSFKNIKSIVYSVNMMRNFHGTKFNSKLYAELMKSVSSLISKSNSGIKRDQKFKDSVSKRTKNKIVVYDKRDPEKKKFVVDKTSEIYDKENHLFYRNGEKHTSETKKKIGKKGKKWITDGINSKMIYPGELPENFYYGTSAVSDKEYLHGTNWYHNKLTGETKRFLPNEIKEDFVIGRNLKENRGFLVANNMKNVVDFELRKSTKVATINKKIHGPDSGQSTEKTKIYTFDNKIFTNFKSISTYCENFSDIVLEKNILLKNGTIRQYHHNNNEKTKNFRKKYAGLTYNDLGVVIYSLSSFDINLHNEKEINWK